MVNFMCDYSLPDLEKKFDDIYIDCIVEMKRIYIKLMEAEIYTNADSNIWRLTNEFIQKINILGDRLISLLFNLFCDKNGTDVHPYFGMIRDKKINGYIKYGEQVKKQIIVPFLNDIALYTSKSCVNILKIRDSNIANEHKHDNVDTKVYNDIEQFIPFFKINYKNKSGECTTLHKYELHQAIEESISLVNYVHNRLKYFIDCFGCPEKIVFTRNVITVQHDKETYTLLKNSKNICYSYDDKRFFYDFANKKEDIGCLTYVPGSSCPVELFNAVYLGRKLDFNGPYSNLFIRDNICEKIVIICLNAIKSIDVGGKNPKTYDFLIKLIEKAHNIGVSDFPTYGKVDDQYILNLLINNWIDYENCNGFPLDNNSFVKIYKYMLSHESTKNFAEKFLNSEKKNKKREMCIDHMLHKISAGGFFRNAIFFFEKIHKHALSIFKKYIWVNKKRK